MTINKRNYAGMRRCRDIILISEITPRPEAGSTKHENPPLPPLGKWEMGEFSYKLIWRHQISHYFLPKDQ